MPIKPSPFRSLSVTQMLLMEINLKPYHCPNPHGNACSNSPCLERVFSMKFLNITLDQNLNFLTQITL